jgi:hypothetical protein
MNPTNDPVARMESENTRLRAERRMLRRLTEEERAARWERIMQLLQFLFHVIPTLSGGLQVAATDLRVDTISDLESLLDPMELEPTIHDIEAAEEEVETA